MCTFFYVDGFNLYYVALKGAPWNQLLASIRNGFHLDRFGKQLPREPPHAPIQSPVFSERKGVITVIPFGGYGCMGSKSSMGRSAIATPSAGHLRALGRGHPIR